MENKKILLVLNSANPWHRILRRALVGGALAFLGAFINSSLLNAEILFSFLSKPAVQVFIVPVLTALGLGIDKFWREWQKVKNQ